MIAAERICRIAWLGSRIDIRVVRIDGRVWFVVADLCRALNHALSSNGRPNVTEALTGIVGERRFGRLETDRGSLKPYTRFALVSLTGLVALAARARSKAAPQALDDIELQGWIAQAVAALAAREDEASAPPPSA